MPATRVFPGELRPGHSRLPAFLHQNMKFLRNRVGLNERAVQRMSKLHQGAHQASATCLAQSALLSPAFEGEHVSELVEVSVVPLAHQRALSLAVLIQSKVGRSICTRSGD